MTNNPGNKPPSLWDSISGVFVGFLSNPVNVQKLTFFTFLWIVLVAIALLAYSPIGPYIKPIVAIFMPINDNDYPWYVKIFIISGLYWSVVSLWWFFTTPQSSK